MGNAKQKTTPVPYLHIHTALVTSELGAGVCFYCVKTVLKLIDTQRDSPSNQYLYLFGWTHIHEGRLGLTPWREAKRVEGSSPPCFLGPLLVGGSVL